jgi:hypothetical protein
VPERLLSAMLLKRYSKYAEGYKVTNNIKNCVKIIYETDPCKKCGGQIMYIFVMKDMVDRRCIKCNNLGVSIRPECEEERIGRLMHLYYGGKTC